MKTTNMIAKATGPSKAGVGNHNVQVVPIMIESSKSDESSHLKVDIAFRTKTKVFVAGWTTADVLLGINIGGRAVPTRRLMTSRPDVAKYFNLPDAEVGFVLVTDHNIAKATVLTWRSGTVDSLSLPLKFVDIPAPSAPEIQLLGNVLALTALTLPPHTPEWVELIGRVVHSPIQSGVARGYLEAISVCEQTNAAIIVGWCVHTPSVQVWLEDESGNIQTIDKAYRRYRRDVNDAMANEFRHCGEAGMIVSMPNVNPGSVIFLKALSATGVHILASRPSTRLPTSPVEVARWLFSIGIPLAELHKRIPVIDEPVLGRLLALRQSQWDDLPVVKKHLGERLSTPIASIIIPLYGRLDFVEHQLMEFYQDQWLMENVEIIYVLDDPALCDEFLPMAESLYRIYKCPFSWVWGSVNRGFSGANNLGAQHSRGEYLVFLNSDAFPQHAGWARTMVDVLVDNPDVGAVGPRLTFASGGIQHSGMEFLKRDELGIWINHHPNMGLAPELDPNTRLTIVPSVTGACLVTRRRTFELIGGWDIGYLIGDFEDSDLCLKIRSIGLKIGYLPTVQLTHLERQSFKLLGHDDFRNRVVIYNAVRHQQRWGSLIEASTTEQLA